MCESESIFKQTFDRATAAAPMSLSKIYTFCAHSLDKQPADDHSRSIHFTTFTQIYIECTGNGDGAKTFAESI